MAAPIFKFAGMNTLADPAAIACFNGKSSQYGQCVDICNCDIDDEHNAISRDGFSLVQESAAAGARTIDGVTYCVSGGHLCTFDGSLLTTLTVAFTVLDGTEFVAVNNVVAFSDGEKYGIIDGATVTRIDNAAAWTAAESVITWVTDHYPANFQAPAANFEVDAFKLPARAGRCLDFYNGALYYAIANFVFCTKTFDVEHEDIRYSVVAGFAEDVTMIGHVVGGLYVGTGKGVWYLEGGGIVVDENGKVAEGFSSRRVSEYGAICGTAVQSDATHVPSLQTQGEMVLWASPLGIFAGCGGGMAVNLSADRITLPDVTQGTAQFREKDGLYQYVVCFDTSAAIFSDGFSDNLVINTADLKGTWLVNLRTLAHSRYARYPFNSLFRRGTNYYGANCTGIYRFTGDTDFAGGIPLAQMVEAFVLTPAVSFTGTAAHVPDIYLDGRCTGEMALDLIVDEETACEDIPVQFDDRPGTHRRRIKAPRGVRGVVWQFRLKNIAGSRFTAIGLEPVVAASARRSR